MGEIARRLRPIAAFLVILVAFGFYNQYKKSSPHEAPMGLASVGDVIAVQGSVEHRWPSRIEMLPLKASGPLHAGELISTNASSQALVKFKNGAEVKVLANSQMVSELDSTREGAIRATVVSGEVEIVKPAANGLFRLFREGRDITEAGPKSAIVIPVGGGTEASSTAKTGDVLTATTPAETPTPGTTSSAGPARPTDLSTLSNDEIKKTFAKNTGFFQRCYLAHLSRKGASAAHSLTIGFTIQPTGKVSQAKVVRSEFQDVTLNNCVLETVERTSFRPFNGDAIPILEFPIELK